MPLGNSDRPDFATANLEKLEAKLPETARMIWGDVEHTVGPYLKTVASDAPIGFVAMDLDFYSSTKSALDIFNGAPVCCLPVTMTYFDDTLGSPWRIGSLFRNRWSGQFLAIEEFNGEHELRKIDEIFRLKDRRPLDRALWLEKMAAVHILDHPVRTGKLRRTALKMERHVQVDTMSWPM